MVSIAAANIMSYPTPSFCPFTTRTRTLLARRSSLLGLLIADSSEKAVPVAFREPHFSCVPLHDPCVCAVDGNHQSLCFFALPSPLRCRRAEGSDRDKMPHLLFSVLEGSFLTSERGPLLVFLRSQSALPLCVCVLAFSEKNNASMYVFRD